MTAHASQTVTITHNLGLHLRAAGALVQAATQFEAHITVQYGRLQANGKSIMSVLALAAPCGAVIEISAQGEDAESSVEALIHLVKQDFGLEKSS